MKLSRLLIALALSCLGGCATERAVFGLAPEQQAAPDTRPRPKTVKLPRTWPFVVQASAAEPDLPPWTVPSAKPARVLKDALSPTELFKKVGPAVYAVLGQRGAHEVTSQGSAVAVSSKEAITNCHVVAQAKVITLANAGTTLRAELIAADRKTDRCYLRVLDGELEPVPGLRDYSALEVGEAVFTIGSPKGLVNTLGQGVLSGLRRSEDEVEYIQITAPVSEGSSGGGVFDDRGNLIGVATFTIRDGQNLNFAIAASRFWK
jgi:S1-C subfamily serine protease